MAAAIATIDEFKSKDVISHIHTIGKSINQKCKKIISEYKLDNYVQLIDCEWQPLFIFKDQQYEVSSLFRTLVLQEMIKCGVLFQGIFVPSFSHTNDDINYFAEAFDESMKVYKAALENGVEKYLVGEPTMPVFRKYL